MTLCVASQRVFSIVVYFVMTQSGNFWIHLVCVCVCVVIERQVIGSIGRLLWSRLESFGSMKWVIS
jgi:hypothetical protein